MRSTFRDMTKKVTVFNLEKQPRDMDDQTFEVNLIENLTSEHSDKLELEAECEFELKYEDFQHGSYCQLYYKLGIKPNFTKSEATNLTPSIESSPGKIRKTR